MSRPILAAVLPSRNESPTIAGVALTVDQVFADRSSLIINADASKDDRTIEAFQSAAIAARRQAIRLGAPGKGRQVLAGIKAVDHMPDVILVVDTDNKAPQPTIYRALVDEVLAGTEYAIAGYSRHWFEGNFTNHVARPLMLANTGLDIPQPISGDFAMSGRLAFQSLAFAEDCPVAGLREAIDGYGIDPLFALIASKAGKSVKTVETQRPKLHAPSFPHLPKVFLNTLPVVLSPDLRTHVPSPTEWRCRYGLNSPDATPDISAMIRELERQGATTVEIPLPILLARKWHSISNEKLLEATNDLWVPYLSWVKYYLQMGLHRGLVGAEQFLQEGGMMFVAEFGRL